MASKILHTLIRKYSKKVGGEITKIPKETPPSPWKVIKDEFDPKKMLASTDTLLPVPRETDILIIGGGAVGSAVAYWLKQRHPRGFTCTVVERDPTYTRASTVLSVGGLRQQFSLKENIQMSQFSAEFLRNIKEHLSVLGMDPPDVQFNPQGYLFLASESGADTMRRNHELQTSLGAKVDLMSNKELKEKFPWLNTDGIELGSYGIKDEGWFDPWLLMNAFKAKAESMETRYIKGEVVNFIHKTLRNVSVTVDSDERNAKTTCNEVQIRTEDGKIHNVNFCIAINCAGPWAGEVAHMAGVGAAEEGVFAVPLPILPRKRYVYVVHCPGGPGLECPLVVDPSGTYFRREGLGGYYICGASPAEDEADHQHTGVEVEYFHEKLFPSLCQRAPVFKTAQLKSAWAGYYDYNYFDQNLIIGNHPLINNMVFAGGSSGHGIQHAPAIGRAIMELILDDEYQTIDLKRLSFDRIITGDPVFEENIV